VVITTNLVVATDLWSLVQLESIMPIRSVPVRRHAIFKRQYRRAVAAASGFHTMTPASQWALLRAQLIAEAATGEPSLIDMLDSRESRRDEVLAELEVGRRSDLESLPRQRS
jgi:hypothetical protein